MSRVYNFSAGPAVLPEEVLAEASAEMLDYRGTGMSVMEMSHRSKAYQTIIDEAESDLRGLLHIPDNYKVLFLQGGASQQFAMVPMNLMKNKVADYIVTGQWAKKACSEGKLYGTANAVASSADKTFSYIPDCSDLPISEDADYVYICENNTIYGTKYKTLPNTKGKLLVADQSSCFLSEPVDVSKYGLIFAGAAAVICMGYNLLYFELPLPNGQTAQLLDLMDYISNSFLMPFISLLTCIFVGWVIGPSWIDEEMELNGTVFKRKKMYAFMIRYVTPVMMTVLFLQSAGIFTVIRGLFG